jgi:DNA-binding NarL/FixJ family response regulator
MLHVAIIEDDDGIRDSLVDFLSSEPEISSVISTPGVEQFFELIGEIKPEKMPTVMLLDINLPGMNGIDAIPKLKSSINGLEIIMNSVLQDSASVFRSLQAGASGYIDKASTFEKIREAIITVSEGGSPMTPAIARKVVEYFNPAKRFTEPLTKREEEVAHGIIDGLSYKLIADRHTLSIDTVRKHIRKIYRKLQINSKGELIAKFHHGI